MPLIDLQTNLRDLKFGNDRTAEGSSQQPFIQTKLPGINESLQSEVSLSAEGVLDKITAIAPLAGTAISAVGSILPSLGGPVGAAKSAFATLAEAGRELGLGISQATDAILNVQLQLPVAGTGGVEGGTDFILRGGTLLPNKIEKDIKRLSKFFASPNGFQFKLKQNILSRLSVKTQASGFLINDGIYTQLSTLTSAAGTAFGIRVSKQLPAVQNILTLLKNPTLGKYEIEVYERDNNEWEKSSRLFQLQNSIITGTPHTLGGIGPKNFKIGGIKLNPDAKLFEKFKGNVLLKYGGGPDAFLGTIGNTNIRFASERAFNATSDKTLKYTYISNAGLFNSLEEKQLSNPAITDFRKILKRKLDDAILPYHADIETRLYLGSPGNKAGISTERDAGLAYSSTSYDRINALPIYQSEKVKNDEANFRTCSMVMNQYKDFYKFKLKQDINSTDTVLEKINKKEILNILDIAIFHEHNLIWDLQSKLINPVLKETQGKDLVKDMVEMLRDKMMLKVCEEVFVISTIKYDFLLKSSDLEKINDSLAIKEIFFVPSIQENDIGSLRSSRLIALQNFSRDECDIRSCYSSITEPKSDLVLLSPTMTFLTNNRFMIFFKQLSILPRIIGNNGPII